MSKYRSEIGDLDAAMGETGIADSTLLTIEEEMEVAGEHGVVHIVPAWKWFLG